MKVASGDGGGGASWGMGDDADEFPDMEKVRKQKLGF